MVATSEERSAGSHQRVLWPVVTVVLACGLLGLSACGDSGGSAVPTPSSTSSASALSGGGSGSVSQSRKEVNATVRVANLYSPDGLPMAIDIYDDAVPADHPKPVVSNLAFGTVSAPFHLTVPTRDLDTDAGIYGVEAGRRPKVARDFHGLADVGFATGATALVVIADNDLDSSIVSPDPLERSASKTYYEVDPNNQHGGPTVTAPAGQSVVSGQSFAMDNTKAADGSPVSVTWFVDGECATNVGNDTGSTVSTVESQGSLTNFVLPVGQHTLQIFLTGSMLPPCSQMAHQLANTRAGTIAGKVTYAFPYGPVASPKILVVPSL